MKIESVKFVCFSPTGTTRSILRSMERGMGMSVTEFIDITMPGVRTRQVQTSENELLVVAVPVYVGRVPALVTEWLTTIIAHQTPAVCVAVYGNRDYDDALLELKNVMKKCGAVPLAFAAFIGEHSFSGPETPIAVGRPDADDLQQAESFGRDIIEKMRLFSSVDQIADLPVPGSFPYSREAATWIVDFIAVSDSCTQCGMCANQCPVAAIDPYDSSVIDTEKCILCCACIKGCPQKAKSMKPGPVKDAAIRVNNNFKERKEPVFFLS